MTVKLVLKDKTYEVKAGITGKQALAEIEIPWQTVLITRAGALISGDEVLKEGDVILLVPVITGG